MPFTLSHAVLASPLAKLSGNRLPIAALAIGTMTPDLYRVLAKHEIYLNHQFKGIIYPDLLVGMLFCFLWYCLYRPMLFKFFGIHKPLSINSIKCFSKFFLWMIIAIILGTATHIIWDGLTHLDFRTFAFQDFLAQPVNVLSHTYPMHKVLQISCSIFALPFLGWMSMHYYLKYKTLLTISKKLRVFCCSLFTLCFFVGCSFYIYTAKLEGFHPQNTDLYNFIGYFIKTFTQGSILCFSFGCLIFHLLNHKKYFD